MLPESKSNPIGGQGCSMLDTVIVQDTFEVHGIVIERGVNIGFAIVSQEI